MIKWNTIIFLLLTVILNSGCATIIGGSNYYAHVVVKDRKDALIYYKGEKIGKGSVYYKLKRRDANNLTFSIKEEGCKEQDFSFKYRRIRGIATIGSILTFNGFINGFPIPIGLIVDIATGALCKPDVNEKGISKENYKIYRYDLEYEGCNDPKITNTPENIKKYIFYLKNGSTIRGEILEMIPSQYVKVKTQSDNILNIAIEDIERATEE